MSVVPENAPTVPKTARFWCFTWFPPPGIKPMVKLGAGSTAESIRMENYDATKISDTFNWPLCEVGADKELQSLVYQQEVCPESGKIHIQGYAEFSKPCRFQYCQAVLNVGSAHHSVRQKSREACVKYCTKTETRAPDTVPVVLGIALQQAHPRRVVEHHVRRERDVPLLFHGQQARRGGRRHRC